MDGDGGVAGVEPAVWDYRRCGDCFSAPNEREVRRCGSGEENAILTITIPDLIL